MLNLNKRGVTLTELMVSIGILAVVALAVSGASQMLMKSASTAEKMTEQIALVNEISGLLSDPTSCTAALASRRSENGTPVSVALHLQAGQNYAGKIMIDNVQLQNVTPISGKTFRADVQISGTKSGAVMGSKNFSKIVRVFYKVDDKNVISKCLGESVDPAANCTALGGTWSDLIGGCDFCNSLGGVWAYGRCHIQADKESGPISCTPVVYTQSTKSSVSGSSADTCSSWESPIFDSTFTYLNTTLGKLRNVKPEDVEAIRTSYSDFYNKCISGLGGSGGPCSKGSSSGVVQWAFSIVSLAQSSVAAGESRCAANVLINIDTCR